MAATYTYDGGDLDRVRTSSVELTQSADHGAIGSGRVTYDDTAGTQAIVGQKDFAVTEDDCATTETWSGFVAPREFGGDGAEVQGPSREIVIEVEDLNSMLGHRLIHQQAGMTAAQGGNRPAETVAARGAWLMASPFVAFADNGRCDFPAVDMDKADYSYQHAGDVLADMALAAGAGWNWHVNDWGSGPELTFRDDNASTADSSTLRISNDPADASAVTLHPKKRAKLRRSPANVISKQAYSYSQGTVVEERPATAVAFNGERAGTASNSNVKTAGQASAQSQGQLALLATEDDVIEVGIDAVPAAQVNLILPGMRTQAKFTHLANTGGRDYDTFTWCRVLERTTRPRADALYELDLKLSPQEVPPAPDICNDLYPPTASGTYYPLGSFTTDADAVAYYWRGGLPIPLVPTPGYVGGWHFSALGAGGLGTIDYAGDCSGNHLILMTVGNGEWTIQTERYGGSVRQLDVRVGSEFSTTVSVDIIGSGDPVVVTIADATDGDCIRVVTIHDLGGPGQCGSKWGWSEAVWVAA